MEASSHQPAVANGELYPAGSARRVAATLRGEGPLYVLETADGLRFNGTLKATDVSKRVGNIPRSLTFADGAVFQTDDNDSIDRWLGQTSVVTGSGLLHQMESRWSWIALSFVAVVMIVFAAGRYGLPWASERIAVWMPDQIVEYVSEGSMELLDRIILDPTTLPEARRKQVANRFESQFGDRYRLHFRELGMPNAFALPAGDVVVTDSFVRLAAPEEFDAVIFHEIGHIEQRHGMQQLVQSSIVTFIIAMVVGDPSGLEEVVVGLPVFLMQSHYSRKHETSADTYAFEEMMARGIDPIHFARIMEKMTGFNGSVEMDKEGQGLEAPDTEAEGGVFDYLSTHPATAERIRRAEEMSEVFRGSGSE